MRNACANFGCAAKAHEGQTTTTATAGAHILPVILSSGSSGRIRNQNIDHFRAAVCALIPTFFTRLYLQALRTELRRNCTGNMFFTETGKHHYNLLVPTEIQVIERFQVRHGSIAALIQYGYPTGDAAVTAVYDRKILSGLLCVQIMGNLIGNFLRINFGNQAA